MITDELPDQPPEGWGSTELAEHTLRQRIREWDDGAGRCAMVVVAARKLLVELEHARQARGKR